MNLPPLASFRFFTVAAKTQSFVKAAEQLHVTHGAVSRQVRLLEDAIGSSYLIGATGQYFSTRQATSFLT